MLRYLPGVTVVNWRGTLRFPWSDVLFFEYDRAGLWQVEESAQRRILVAHARAGVTFLQPATTRVEGGRTLRDAFPGNRIPEDRISPIARFYLGFIPLPSSSAGTASSRISRVLPPRISRTSSRT